MSKRLLPTSHEERADVNKVEKIDQKETCYSMWKEMEPENMQMESWHIAGPLPHQDVTIKNVYI